MADERLIFPVGFDLDSSIEQVERDWGKIQRRMQKVIDEKPLTIKMTAGTVDNYKTFSRNARNSINEIREALDDLSKKWNEMADMEKFDASGNLTAKAQGMIQRYNGLTAALETYGRTLSQVVAMEKKSIEQELKTISANRAAYEAQIKANAQKAAAEAKNRADYEKYVNLLRQQQNAETMLTQKGLAAEKQRAELRRQAQKASDDEYQSLVRQLRMEERLAAAEANRARQQKYNAARKQGLERLKILNAEEKSIAAITAKLQVQQQRLQSATFGSAKFKKIADEVQRLSKLLDEANAKIRDIDEVERRRASGINATTAAYGRQMSYVERLITRLGLYTGIYAAAGMIRDIRETTAEFELQEVALGAIIQDAHEAQVLFSQIKAAAVESPYQIKELVNYTKQLAAYGFEQNTLFDTTMKLADISAGLGADMSRIILAVGQISAASVLKGTELRQLTELGIPMVELLADKFTELRGEIVSTGEVFEMISDKAVSFKMVEEILNDLTSAGGMFYDMQRKQAETLAGQWSNLKDSIAIAYDEIGNTGTVRGAMEGVISLLKSMVDNWERTAAVLSGLVTGIATYVAAVKSAALVEALRNRTLADNIKLVRASVTVQPKWVAAIIGETRAKTLNLAMTKALRIARLKEVAATNVASKAFWRLTAAMMSNPYAIVIAAIAALGFTIFNMAKNTRTAEESVDDLNESVASLAKLNNSVKPLVDELDALSSKTEKTTDEQKRLNQVTRELADMYPTTISAVRKYGEEIDVITEKVKALYEAELKASQEATKILIKENEDRLEAIRKSIELRGQQLIQGGVTHYAPYSGTPYIEPFTDEQASKFSKEFQELQAEAKRLEAAIKAAKIELGLLPSEAQQNIDAFGAWRKELEGFILSYKTADGQDIQFFDDEQIDRFNNLNDALAETVKIRKENTDAVAKYNETLKSTTISEDTRARITQERNNAQAHIDTADAIIKHFNAYSLLQEAKGKEDRTPLQVLNEEVSLLEKVYAKYKEFLKYMSSADAKAKTEEYFADTIGSLRFGAAFDTTKLKEILTKYQDAARSLPESDKTVLELGFKVDDVSWQETLDDMKDRVAELADAVARSKEAKDFYDKMLGMTGDRQLSADLTMSVYGGVGDDLKENIRRQLTEAFKGVDISSAFEGDNVDYKKLESLIPQLPEDLRSNARKLVEDGIKDNARWLQDLYKTYEEFKTYEQRRTTVMEREAQKRREIEANTSLTQEQKETQMAASRKREAQELDTIDLEEFKASEDWIQTFENIDKVGTKSIQHLMVVLKEFIATNKDLTPEQLKTLMTEYEKLYQGLIERNPLKAITEGAKEYFVALKELRKAKKDEGLKEAKEEEKTAEKEVKVARKDVKQADTDEDRAAASLRLAQAEERLAKAEKKRSDAESKVRKAQDKQRTALSKVQSGVNEAAAAYNALNDVVSGVMETFNIDETSELGVVLKSVAQALTMVAGVLGVINAIITLIETHPLVLAISAGIMSIIGAIMLFQNLKTADSERIIKEQEKLLEDLEYQYKKLEKAAESAFGTEYLDNFKDRLENLYDAQAAYQKQAQAERDKGKQADEDAIKDYENSALDTADKIAELEKEVSEKMLGTDLGSAARDFADAWLEAYKTFGNTADAIGTKFREMIDNMVAESVIAGVMKTALRPVFTMIDNMTADDLYDPKFWQKLGNEVETATEDADVGATNAMRMLEAMGINIREMGQGLTGISKDIATASEESILGLAAGINTQNSYISQIHAAVLRIEMLMQSGGTGVNIQDLVTIQNQHLAHLPNIAANTANTLAECRSILAQVTNIADNLGRVITANGTSSTHQLHTTLS